ncbi:MAG TPA: DUF488 domain-containing protein, partial [Actinomycetaceae bacterium]|nr:DUF488 domain-containing protein [Actinomycetaceae bacterium]
VGHGQLDRAALGKLLGDAGVTAVVDVRRFPGSRTNPDARREALEEWLPALDIDYRWEERLGGRRHLRKAELAASADTWWRVSQFRAYATHTREREFHDAMSQLLALARSHATAVMCSESVWWRCHRRLIADVAVLAHGWTVHHLMPDGRLAEHVPAEGARLRDDGEVVWDG